jgi:hypothetical protein
VIKEGLKVIVATAYDALTQEEDGAKFKSELKEDPVTLSIVASPLVVIQGGL